MTVVVRETSETNIRCELTRGSGRASVATGQPFLDHMLVAFSRYSGLDLSLQATGDLQHHLIEDVAICLGGGGGGGVGG
jgi:imidazoleglycerol-phosphate dehydratase